MVLSNGKPSGMAVLVRKAATLIIGQGRFVHVKDISGLTMPVWRCQPRNVTSWVAYHPWEHDLATKLAACPGEEGSGGCFVWRTSFPLLIHLLCHHCQAACPV